MSFLKSSLLITCFILFSCSTRDKDNTENLIDYVNPMIGTGGHGHTFPGAVVPFGMIQPSPDTRIYQWDACSGYHYDDTSINGFSHTHLSGTGCGDYGDILIMPTVGEQHYNYLGDKSQQTAYASAFSHANEVAKPGYYAVFLDTYQVKAELSATHRSAIHRYTFPQSDSSGFIVDIDYNLQNQRNDDMSITILSDTEICGSKKTSGWAKEQQIYFYAQFSKPFTATTVEDTVAVEETKSLYPRCKALLHFSTKAQEEVFLKIGISAVDIAGAKNNVKTEIPSWNFEKVRSDAEKAWNTYLTKIEVKTKDTVSKEIFYTALYHTGISPNLFSDQDGHYRGMDQQIHPIKQSPAYTVFSLWDTFRALHPLFSIIIPEQNGEFIQSLLSKYEEGGVLPMWDLADNYTATMIGYHAVPVIVDAYTKGISNFDVNLAYRACLHSATYDTLGIIAPKAMIHGLMPLSKKYKNELGYIPCDLENESVAKGLEYAYDDWCIATFAKALQDDQNAAKFDSLSQNYRNYYDAQTGFMRGLDSNHKWSTPFNPYSSDHRNDNYCEGTAWQWLWFVPQDIEGLVKLVGGKAHFITKLDSLFMADSRLDGSLVSADISGLIGQYAHGNEPSHHITHLYNYVNQPYKTQALVDSILTTLYTNGPDGLSGNEDCGQMSAWYVLNSLGFYQVCPGNPIYSIGRPLFDSAKIKVAEHKYFEIIAKNNSPKNKYIVKATLNGKALTRPFFSHQDLVAGGTLKIEMGPKPTSWGE